MAASISDKGSKQQVETAAGINLLKTKDTVFIRKTATYTVKNATGSRRRAHIYNFPAEPCDLWT